MSASNNVVTVTGASGFIAGVLIDHLLKKGYTVHGTVRSLKDTTKLQPFLDVFAAPLASKQLQLFEADLHVAGSFANAIKGSKFVFHTASPFFIGKSTDPQKDFIIPAVEGTQNVLHTAFAEPSVQRIVVTSSVAAVRSNVPAGQKVLFSDKDWNKTATIETAPYPLSKTLAEKKAWELFEEHKKAGGKKVLTVVNPAWVLGPPVHVRSATDSESIKNVTAFFDGSLASRGYAAFRFAIADVRDVVNTHIASAENESASGRYLICSEEAYGGAEWVKMLSELFPEYKSRFPNKLMDGAVIPGDFGIDNSRAVKELGVKLTPLQQTFKDTVEQLKKFGLIKP